MEPVFSVTQGVILVGGYALFVWLLTWIFSRRFHDNKLQFLVANRQLGSWEAALSIAATWIWAPALFIAAERAYTQGWVGLFWFTVPNVSCLIIFSYFAVLVRKKMPEGFTLSGYIKQRYSKRVQNLYLLELSALSVCSFAVQLLAGATVVTTLTGIPFIWVTIMLAAIALSYSMFSGLKASVITDYAQMALILIVGFTLVPWAVANGGGFDTVIAGLYGKSETYTSLFSGDGGSVFFTFGIAVTIGLMAGPFGDQAFWQRAFATRENVVQKAFVRGALLFVIVPLLMSLLGFVAAGKGMEVDSFLVNMYVIKEFLPVWSLVPFLYMLLSGLVSTLDSCLCSISSLAGHDIQNRIHGETPETDNSKIMFSSRTAMLLLAVFALVIANLPGMKVLYLFLVYGTLRAATLIPTIITLLTERVNESAIFWGIATSLTIGFPMFAYAKLNGMTNLAIVGSLFTVFVSGIITYFGSLSYERKPL